jgi:hypothetical protein
MMRGSRLGVSLFGTIAALVAACTGGGAGSTTGEEGAGPSSESGEGGAPDGEPALNTDTGPAPSCTDHVKNGGETDVDCGGGSCPPCADGKHCSGSGDCTTKQCAGGTCCTTKDYEKNSGPVSGYTQNCCEKGDDLIKYEDCGTGSDHTVMPAGNCAFTSEGSGNNGSACSHITCRSSTCSKSCQGDGYMKSTGPGGGQICCTQGDKLTKVVDCGDGKNHSVSTSGNCGVAVEGSGNYGSACALIFCSTTPCPGNPDAGPDAAPPPPK